MQVKTNWIINVQPVSIPIQVIGIKSAVESHVADNPSEAGCYQVLSLIRHPALPC